MKCKTCSHPQRQAIDLALLTRTHTLEALSAVYGLSISSLFRHKKHLQEKLDRSRQRLQDVQTMGSLLKLKATLDDVIQTAKAAGDIDRVVKSVRAGSRIVLRMSKIDLPLDQETLYRLLSSPQRFSQGNTFPFPASLFPGGSPAPAETHPQHMRDVSAKLPKNPDCRANNNQQYQSVNNCEKIYPKHPCVARDPQGGASQSTAPPTSQTSSCQSLTANAQIPSRQMANPEREIIFTTDTRKLETVNREPFAAPGNSPAPETLPKPQRDGSAKKARKIAAANNFSNLFQYDKFLEKNCSERAGQGLSSVGKKPVGAGLRTAPTDAKPGPSLKKEGNQAG